MPSCTNHCRLWGLLLWCLLWGGGKVGAQPTDVPPATPEIRHFDPAKRDVFLHDRDFRYDRQAPPTAGWWERFLHWLYRQIAKVFQYEGSGFLFRLLVYVGAAALLVYVVLRVIGTDVSGLFYRNRASGQVKFEVMEENIHAVDFEKEVADALAAQDFRRAVRMRYLHALKLLTDRGLIRWQPGKTNQEYDSELAHAAVRQPFHDLRTVYEYAWYGDFPVGASGFERAGRLFQQLQQQLR
ncbi:protein of unknown function [Catalinimonas alkaloidigena]|uniref:Protein-glutamine gamma-glutamyltransferase-like C-terminal domain-containing protein n=1 Tax=Catalinimonas alkaloidigena TaxID=1075417 RepID=A0A1G9IN54_9BACT|nr:DUF4129 domain-containing protein [Catalinimonas alkaloidigena]SDL26698.1 protein of unknown function [Catalinimonas alkaloidigena]